MRFYSRVLAVSFMCCGVLSGCRTDPGPMELGTPTFPTQPTPQPTPQPPPSFVVSGVVSHIVGGQTMPLNDVRVEDSERHVWVTTAVDGSYTITDVAVSAFGGAYIYFTKNGYRGLARQFPLTGEHRVDVTLVRE